MPEGFNLHDGKLIVADIYDYDGDGVTVKITSTTGRKNIPE